MTTTPLFDFAPETQVIEQKIEAESVSPARETDPETSHEAASAFPEIRSEQRLAVFRYLHSVGEKGATDYAIAEALGILRTSAGKRRKELVEAGYVEFTERFEPTDTGSTARVWALKPEYLLLREEG